MWTGEQQVLRNASHRVHAQEKSQGGNRVPDAVASSVVVDAVLAKAEGLPTARGRQKPENSLKHLGDVAIGVDAQGRQLNLPASRDFQGKQVQASKPLLGVETVNVTGLSSDVVSRFGVTASAGAFVQRVSPGSGAAGAGLQQGDVIVAIDGKRIRTNEDVGQVVRSKQPGDRIEITYERRGEQQTGTATLGQR